MTVITDSYVSASSIRNYMLDDPLLLWAEYFGVTTLDESQHPSRERAATYSSLRKSPFKEYILEQGHVFEKRVFQELRERADQLGMRTVQIVPDDVYASESIEYMQRSKEIILCDAYDVIYQAVVHSANRGTYGTIDLLIRPSCLKRLFPSIASVPDIAPYVVIDIKHSKISTGPTGWIQTRENPNIPAYKAQLLIYSRMISDMFGGPPVACYILGKDGVIGQVEMDPEIIDKTDAAIEFVHRMRREGHLWRLLPTPTIQELYPNMKHQDMDPLNTRLKRELATAIGEITDVWYCGYNRRMKAHRAGIKSWRDPRFNSRVVGINWKVGEILDKMLKVNRESAIGAITMERAISRDTGVLDFYIDYETFNQDMGGDMIFMIGVGWIEAGEWQFKNFIAEERTDRAEHAIMEDFNRFIQEKLIHAERQEYRLIHWSNAEVAFYQRYTQKNPDAPALPFYDLLENDFMGNIVISGCLNFSLKTIGKTMSAAGIIPSSWDLDNPCANGLDAMYTAHEIYEGRIDRSEMRNIADYNEMDCKIMYYLHDLICGLSSAASLE